MMEKYTYSEIERASESTQNVERKMGMWMMLKIPAACRTSLMLVLVLLYRTHLFLWFQEHNNMRWYMYIYLYCTKCTNIRYYLIVSSFAHTFFPFHCHIRGFFFSFLSFSLFSRFHFFFTAKLLCHWMYLAPACNCCSIWYFKNPNIRNSRCDTNTVYNIQDSV